MTSRRTALAAIAGAALAMSGMLAAEVRAAEPIRIGDINSYTRMPDHSVPYRNGFLLAMEQINATGGVLGRPVELIWRDDDSKPGTAVKIAEELVANDKVVLLTGSVLSNIGLALAGFADQKKVLYIAAEPLADDLVWDKGNRYTFRMRASTYMQAAMLAKAAAKNPAKRWATIAPNYAYGKDAVAAFKKVMKELRPDVEFVAEQWPPLFKIDATAEAQAMLKAKPEAIYNVTFGSDLAKFAREGRLTNLFKDRLVLGLLNGEPEYLDPLGAEAPEGWLVTGYPWYAIESEVHRKFVADYQKRFNDYPRIGSIVGYNNMLGIRAMIEKAKATDTEAMVDALEGLEFDTPIGRISYRALDHQATMGAWVGRTALKDGKGIMVDWTYEDGARYLPSDDEVRKLRHIK